MKRWIVLVMIFALLVMPAVCAEESNEGEVIVVDDFSAADSSSGESATDEEPYVPDNIDRAIFGKDDRITVYNPAAYPYSAIAYMEVTGTCGDSWTGTGFMVSKNKMITAAHCLVCPEHSAWAKYIDFYFGYKNKRNYLYRYNSKWTAKAGNVFSGRTYTTTNDFGCIKFKKNVGDTTGWLGVHWNRPDARIESDYLYVAGYRDGVLRYDSGWANVLDSTRIAFKMDALPGNSGGPLFTEDNYCVGINIAQNDLYNTAYRLTGTVKKCMEDTK